MKNKGYAKTVTNVNIPQKKKASEKQVKNRAGGYVFEVDDWKRLSRFLILGCENGSYYASSEEMSLENYDCVKRCLCIDHKKTIDTIVEISDNGRAVKNEPCVFSLAVCSVFGNEEARAYANKAMPKVARFSTHMYQWVHDILSLKDGRKGKGFLRSLGRWYTEKDLVALAYQVCKYPQRSVNGKSYSHADMLRMARISSPKKGKIGKNGMALTMPNEKYGDLFQYVVHGITDEKEISSRKKIEKDTGKSQESPGITPAKLETWKNDDSFKYVWAHEKAKKVQKVSEIVSLIKEYNLTRESIPPQFRNEIEVQRALLEKMPMTALIRNLGQFTASGLLKSLSKETSLVVSKITDKDALKRSRIHPMTLLMAKKVYDKGNGMRTSWTPVQAISDALEEAFYSAFEYIEPTNKRYLLGVDVSGSMFWGGSNDIMASEAAAVMAMTIARSEKNYEIMAFSDTFKNLGITIKDSLKRVMSKTSNLTFGSTDCALPMIYALEKDLDVDVFVIFTDNETWYGAKHPFQALKDYRRAKNPNAKLIVCAFDSSKFSIADPSDAGMMDIAGLDSNVPKLIAEFANDNI